MLASGVRGVMPMGTETRAAPLREIVDSEGFRRFGTRSHPTWTPPEEDAVHPMPTQTRVPPRIPGVH